MSKKYSKEAGTDKWSPTILEEERFEKEVVQLKAKKAFEINHNDYHRDIQVGDDLSDVPVMYHQNLKTEGVI